MKLPKSILAQIPAAAASYWRSPSTLVRSVRWRLSAQVSQRSHIFVVGAPRSGTTLVESLLASHPDICSSYHESALFGWRNIFDPNRKLFGLPSEVEVELLEHSTDVVDLFDLASSLFLKNQKGAVRFLEKTPQHVLQLRFILAHFPNAQTIHVVRDGRDAYCSARQAGIPHGGSLAEYAAYWSRCLDARTSCGQHPQIADVRYEDLCTRPHEEMGRLFRFLELDTLGGKFSYGSRTYDRRASSPIHSKIAEPVNPASVGRYRCELSHDEIRRFNDIARSQLDLYGYLYDRDHSGEMRQE